MFHQGISAGQLMGHMATSKGCCSSDACHGATNKSMAAMHAVNGLVVAFTVIGHGIEVQSFAGPVMGKGRQLACRCVPQWPHWEHCCCGNCTAVVGSSAPSQPCQHTRKHFQCQVAPHLQLPPPRQSVSSTAALCCQRWFKFQVSA